MAKEEFVRTKPHVNIGTIGHVAQEKEKGGYQSGQMGQTVNLLAMPSVVRIHHYPLFPKITQRYKDPVFIMRIGFFVFISPQII